MKILAFSDMHGSRKALKQVIEKSKEADFVLCCGDLTIFEQDLKLLLGKLDRIKKPILMIPGNHENSPTLKKACSEFRNIVYMEGRAFESDKLIILGAEGNGFSITDREFDKVAKSFLKILKSKKKGKKYVLMTHAPPYDTRLDRLFDGGHCGNKSIREFILKSKPLFAFSGHIHENSGRRDRLGDTSIINPGPYGMIVRV